MKFRLFIFKDPDKHDRGYSLAGIKVPLTTFVPVSQTPDLLSYDDSPVYGRYPEYWRIPVCLLIMARPSLAPHLRNISELLVPTDWVDVAPVDSWEKLPSSYTM